jgi:hypothetical protein
MGLMGSGFLGAGAQDVIIIKQIRPTNRAVLINTCCPSMFFIWRIYNTESSYKVCITLSVLLGNSIL